MQRPPEVERYLRHFPKVQWERGIELTLLLGIQTVYQRFPYGFTLDMLAKAVTPKTATERVTSPQQGKRVTDSPGSLTGRSYGTAPTPDQPTRSSPHRRELHDSKRLRIPEKPPIESAPQSKGEGKRLPKHLRDVTSKIREEVQRDIQRYHSPERPSSLQIDDSAWETRIKPYPAPAPKSSKPASMNSSKLIEPRTNTAYAEKLGARQTSDSNVLRITDRFLADPFLATLSSQTSPKAAADLWPYPS